MTRTVDIGGYKVGAVWLAPMAGYTDIAFRELCKSYGAGLTVSEMVSVRGLMYGSANTAPLMRLADSEKPSCIQLFGSEPDDFARVADKLDCDMIDINIAERLGRFSAVAVGRAALGDPAIFGGVTVPPETVAREHMRLLVKYFDDRYAVNQARKFFVHYFKGADGGKALRAAVNVATTADDVFSALDKFAARS